MNDKAATSEPAAFDPASAGWKIVKQAGFGELVGPIWRLGDARFGVVVEARHLNFADIVHGGLLATLADQAMGMTALRATGNKPHATIELNMQIRRRGAPWRIRRSALRNRADHPRDHLHAVQARRWHAGRRQRDWHLEDKRGGVRPAGHFPCKRESRTGSPLSRGRAGSLTFETS